jgi:aryl-alcohol dehydrogenase-like predicted oxidoreductase
MDYVWLGRTGVKVSTLCAGTMAYGGDADEAASAAMYAACRERGINNFDCADTYAGGRSEEILGRLMAHERDQLVVASKCFNPTGAEINERGANRRHIVRAVEASLRRLGTDRLDILYMHKWDPVAPLEETLRALEDLVRSGKTLYLGASNYAAWQVATGLGISTQHGWSRFDVLQPMYNLVKRQAETEILPLARAEGLAVMTYSPVGGGLLSGKYGTDQQTPETGRLLTNKEYTARYGDAWAVETAARFTALAGARGLHPVTLAVAWVASHPDVTSPIVGARSMEQLEPSLDAMTVEMPDDLRGEISGLSRQPPPAHDRSEELQRGTAS